MDNHSLNLTENDTRSVGNTNRFNIQPVQGNSSQTDNSSPTAVNTTPTPQSNFDNNTNNNRPKNPVTFESQRGLLKNAAELNNDVYSLHSNFALFEDDRAGRPRIVKVLESFAKDYNPVEDPAKDHARAVEEAESKEGQRKGGANLGTMMGVYLPTIQNIFGVILFIRMAWIVGLAGTWGAFGIVLLCCCTTMATAFSMSAIATNGVVPAGGSYGWGFGLFFCSCLLRKKHTFSCDLSKHPLPIS